MQLLMVKIVFTVLIVIAFLLPFFYPSLGSGFFAEMEMLGLGGALGVLFVFLVLVYIYCKDLEKTLTLVAEENRAAPPKSVWLMFLIPYNFVEDFFIVHNISASIEREASVNAALSPVRIVGFYSGLGWCTAQILSLAPGYIGKTSSLLAIVLWVVHWRFIRTVNLHLNPAKNSILSTSNASTE